MTGMFRALRSSTSSRRASDASVTVPPLVAPMIG
jgi:hypothetical protein